MDSVGSAPALYSFAGNSTGILRSNLENAVKTGDTVTVKLLLMRITGSATANNLNRLLQLATEHNHLAAVELLLKRGADATLYHCPILRACELGYIEIVRLLLEYGACAFANLNMPMKIAAQNGHLAIMDLLQDAGAFGPKFSNNQAFRCAANNWQPNVMRALLSDTEENITNQQCLDALKNKKIEVSQPEQAKLQLKKILNTTVRSLKSNCIDSIRQCLRKVTGSTGIAAPAVESAVDKLEIPNEFKAMIIHRR